MFLFPRFCSPSSSLCLIPSVCIYSSFTRFFSLSHLDHMTKIFPYVLSIFLSVCFLLLYSLCTLFLIFTLMIPRLLLFLSFTHLQYRTDIFTRAIHVPLSLSLLLVCFIMLRERLIFHLSTWFSASPDF